MASLNRKPKTVAAPVTTHGGAPTIKDPAKIRLQRAALACMMWEDQYYQLGSTGAAELSKLVAEVRDPDYVLDMAVQARSEMQLRHLPLFLISEVCRAYKGREDLGGLVENALYTSIQRADELGEFLSIYWGGKDRKAAKRPLSAGVKRGLRAAVGKFKPYQLAKYNSRGSNVSLKDILRLVHPKQKYGDPTYGQIVHGSLAAPDTWEVQLSAGADKKATFERLMSEGTLGGLAFIRNLRGMIDAGVNRRAIQAYFQDANFERVLPFRFFAALKHATEFRPELEHALLNKASFNINLPGKSLLIVDLSGSMGAQISGKSELRRVDAALALASLAREVCASVDIYYTAGNDARRVHATAEIPSDVRGFDFIDVAQEAGPQIGSGGIFLHQVCKALKDRGKVGYERVIVFTDEQDCDLSNAPHTAPKLGRKNYIVNVGSYTNGVSPKGGWLNITGFSEAVLNYIQKAEEMDIWGGEI